jgi:hypothetical protein
MSDRGREKQGMEIGKEMKGNEEMGWTWTFLDGVVWHDVVRRGFSKRER